MTMKCGKCGAASDHFTHLCSQRACARMEYIPTVHEVDPLWSRDRDLSDPAYHEWLKDQFSLLQRELRNLRETHESNKCQRDILLEGPVHQLMVAAREHGPFPPPKDVQIRTFFKGRPGALYFEYTSDRKHRNANCAEEHAQLQQMGRYARTLFSASTAAQVLLGNVERALQDSEEWQEFQKDHPDSMSSPNQLAQRIIDRFPKVKTKVDNRSGVCCFHRTCAGAVRKFIWDELDAERPAVGGLAMLPPPGAAIRRKVEVTVLHFHRHPPELREALLKSDLAMEAEVEGVEIEPRWANGAIVLVKVFCPSLPWMRLRPFNVMVATQDKNRVLAALEDMPYKRRPRVKEDRCVSLSAGTVPQPPYDYKVVKTFIHAYEVCGSEICELSTDAAGVVKSANDADNEHANPRSGVTNSTSALQPKSLAEHVDEMKQCQKVCDLQGAMQCHSNILRDDLRPDTQCFTILIDLCFKNKETDMAFHWFHEMDKQGVPPSVVTFNIVIRSWAKGGKAKKAVKWFDRMIDCGLKPTVQSFKYVSEAYQKQGDFEKSMEWQEYAKSIDF